MNTLEFEVHNQTLIRIDSQEVINKNKNVYKCVFTFEEDSDWISLNKFVIFTDGWGNTSTQHLGNNSNVLSCLVPMKVLGGSYFKISVYAGDLITTNNISIGLIQSGYKRTHPRRGCHNRGEDIFVEIFDRLDNTIDSIVYDNNTLHLFNRENLLESLYLPFLEEEDIRQLVEDLTKDFIVPLATQENDGLLSSEDKIKLDNIENEANHTVVDSSLDSDSGNPVSNSVLNSKFNELQTNITSVAKGMNGIDDNVTENTEHLHTIDESLETIRETLENKEDSYNYIERLDDVIVTLINQGE